MAVRVPNFNQQPTTEVGIILMNIYIHFRRQGRVVEVFIVNVAAEHHDLIIVCLPTNTNSSVLEGCMNGSRSTLFVAPEQDSESECPQINIK